MFWLGSGVRDWIDLLSPLWTHEKVAVTMDGTEKTLVEVSGELTWNGQAFLDLMDAGDTIIVRYYFKKEGGSFVQFDSVTYSNAQTSPAIDITAKICMYAIKVTAEQTAIGTYRAIEVHKHKRLSKNA